jgi:hypothetical protein
MLSNILREKNFNVRQLSHAVYHKAHAWPCFSGFFQDFLLGPFLQRRLSLAEQLGGWGSCGRLTPVPNKCTVVETQWAQRETINWLKIANALFSCVVK